MERAEAVPGGGRPDERKALLGLWSIPGVGPKSLEVLAARVGDLSALLPEPPRSWAPLLRLTGRVRARLERFPSLAALAEHMAGQVEAGQLQVCFVGDAAYPTGFMGLEGMPPLLFFRGRVCPPRRWVAMVGSRRPDPGFLPFARRFAREVAQGGAGIVSGAAEGVDEAAHQGAVDAGAPTWAFVGSGLGELDPAQERIVSELLGGGGTVYTELPPTVRANRTTFPRRNRLIAAAAHAVVVLRAARGSGSLLTAGAARTQGRPVLALPGEVGNPAAEGCNTLVRDGEAQLCLGAADVWRAAGVRAGGEGPAERQEVQPTEPLSPEEAEAYGLLARTPRSFDDVLAECSLGSAGLTIALSELALKGLVVQHPGKLYERL